MSIMCILIVKIKYRFPILHYHSLYKYLVLDHYQNLAQVQEDNQNMYYYLIRLRRLHRIHLTIDFFLQCKMGIHSPPMASGHQ
jgi:hypothetical protein